MLDAILSLAVVAAAVVVGLLVHRIRLDLLPSWATGVVTLTCGAGLIVMVLTDWPMENLASFWASHSVLAGMLSTLLLVGLVFLVYERAERAHQDKLADGLSGAGLGGMVDHMVDIETALALVSARASPGRLQPKHWARWDDQGKPLRWLREGRQEILTSRDDPRRLPTRIEKSGIPSWGPELVDQCTRRLLAGIRDWAPLIGSSQEGTAVLLILSSIRAELMALQTQLMPKGAAAELTDGDRETVERCLHSLRSRLRILALCFEDWSGAPERRPELLSGHAPLSPEIPHFNTSGRALQDRLSRACSDMEMTPR